MFTYAAETFGDSRRMTERMNQLAMEGWEPILQSSHQAPAGGTIIVVTFRKAREA